jgi:hypothetical protein
MINNETPVVTGSRFEVLRFGVLRFSGFIRRSLGAGGVGTGWFRVSVSSAEPRHRRGKAGLERANFGFLISGSSRAAPRRKPFLPVGKRGSRKFALFAKIRVQKIRTALRRRRGSRKFVLTAHRRPHTASRRPHTDSHHRQFLQCLLNPLNHNTERLIAVLPQRYRFRAGIARIFR